MIQNAEQVAQYNCNLLHKKCLKLPGKQHPECLKSEGYRSICHHLMSVPALTFLLVTLHSAISTIKYHPDVPVENQVL